MNVMALMGTLGIDTSQFDKGLQEAEGKARNVGSSIGDAFGNAQKALIPLAAAGGLIGAGLGLAAKAGFDFNNGMEQARAKLNSFNKDTDVTNKQLEFINQEASKTPFAFGEMVNAYGALQSPAKAAGVATEELLKTAQILAAVNPAQGLEGAAVALRSAVGGMLNCLLLKIKNWVKTVKAVTLIPC